MTRDFLIGDVLAEPLSGDIEEKLLEAYDVTAIAEENINEIEKTINDVIPDTFNSCEANSLITKINNMISRLTEVSSNMIGKVSQVLSGSVSDTLKISIGLEQYAATGIILKRVELIRLKTEKIKLVLEKKIVEINNSVLKWFVAGKGSKNISPLSASLSVLSGVGAALNSLMDVISSVLTTLESVTPMNVKGASCCFFLTPKSLNKTDIKILNSNQSTTNNKPNSINELISEAECNVISENGETKKAYIAAAGAAGAEAAVNNTFGETLPITLQKFNPDRVRQDVNLILALLSDADALPRYEKLKITNPRFMTYLATGFEPAAHNTFGIPGFP